MGVFKWVVLTCVVMLIGQKQQQREDHRIQRRFFSNDTSAHCQRSFISVQPDPCAYVQEFCPSESNLDYSYMHYCVLHDIEWLSFTIQIVMVLCTFVWLSTVAEDFFVPQMEAVVSTLKLPENIAGVTFLALANSAPDLVGSILAINTGSANLAISQIIGAGVFVTSVVLGIVSFASPSQFQLTRRPFLRDIGVYTIGVVFMFFITLDGQIVFWESVTLIVLYIVYVLIVVIGRFVNQRLKQSKKLLLNDESGADSSANLFDEPLLSSTIQVPIYSGNNTINEPEEPVPLLRRLFPIIYEWPEARWWTRVSLVIAAPVYFVMAISVPIADTNREDRRWNKYLFAVQWLVLPVWVITATAVVQSPIGSGSFEAWMLALILGVVGFTISMVFTKEYQPPPFYDFMFFFGIIAAALWLYIICGELIGLLQSLGRLMNLSDTILGLTVLAWGNSLGDLVANPSLAHRGHPAIGFSACFGGPLLNLLMGLGIGFTSSLVRSNQPYPLDATLGIWVTFAALMCSLLFSTVFICCNGFRSNRIYGGILLVFYVVFLVTSITLEFV